MKILSFLWKKAVQLYYATIGLDKKKGPCYDDETETYTRAMIRRWIYIGFVVSIFLGVELVQRIFLDYFIEDLLTALRITALVAFALPAVLLIFRYVSYGNAKNMRDQHLVSKADEKTSTLTDEEKRRSITEKYKIIITRFHRVVETSYWMAITNLFIGFLITLLGFALMAYFIHMMDPTFKQTGESIAEYFIPRISLVLLVELFALFFLSLYRDNLKEWKYYQNEITSMEYKMIASTMAIDYNLPEGCQNVVDQLLLQSYTNVLKDGKDKKGSDKETIDNDSILKTIANLTSILSRTK